MCGGGVGSGLAAEANAGPVAGEGGGFFADRDGAGEGRGEVGVGIDGVDEREDVGFGEGGASGFSDLAEVDGLLSGVVSGGEEVGEAGVGAWLGGNFSRRGAEVY